MFPDIGLLELLVLVAVIIVVVGPKELPGMMRTIGEWVGKARATAREFQRSFEDMAREAELAELRKEVESIKSANPLEKLKENIAGPIDPNEPFYPPGGEDPDLDDPQEPSGPRKKDGNDEQIQAKKPDQT